MRDNKSKLGTAFPYIAGSSLPAVNATVTGQWIDLAPYNAAAIYVLAGPWTDGTHAFKVQESPDNGSTVNDVVATDLSHIETANSSGGLPITSVSGANPFLTISSTATALNTRVGYLGGQRYIRVVDTVTPGATGAKYFVVVIAGEPRVLPAQV